MRKLRIVLAEDHATVREGLKLLVNTQSDMIVVGEAADGQATVDLVESMTPDIVVMDISMPLVNGLKATETITKRAPMVKVLALTRHSDNSYVRELLHAGASGYVLKQSPSGEFLTAIRTVASGRAYLDPRILNPVLSEYARPRGNAVGDRPGRGLTPREMEVIQLLVLGYANKDIAARFGLSVKTVETHKTNAMQKLGIHSRVELVRLAHLEGWFPRDE